MQQTIALFDDTHGQKRWQETGFGSREAHTKFSGLAQILVSLGAEIHTAGDQPLSDLLPGTALLVIPPPTGTYDRIRERWRRHASGLFRSHEIVAILRFLRRGGSLLLSAYRFGDLFTQTNLSDLVAGLGCLLNQDAVIDLDRIRTEHALQSQFETPRHDITAPWALEMVQSVLWRAMATFTILPGSSAYPLVVSPGGRCITFNQTFRQISFQSLPVAVMGTHGAGRFVIFGGPHAIETGVFGLLSEANNKTFLENVLGWLIAGEPTAEPNGFAFAHPTSDEQAITEATNERWREFSQVEGQGSGEKLVSFVERLLRQSGILKALSRARWVP